MALKIEAALTALYVAALVALIWRGDPYWPNVMNGTFIAGMSAWKLWRHHRRGESPEGAWLLWMMLASALLLLVATAPQ